MSLCASGVYSGTKLICDQFLQSLFKQMLLISQVQKAGNALAKALKNASNCAGAKQGETASNSMLYTKTI